MRDLTSCVFVSLFKSSNCMTVHPSHVEVSSFSDFALNSYLHACVCLCLRIFVVDLLQRPLNIPKLRLLFMVFARLEVNKKKRQQQAHEHQASRHKRCQQLL